MLYNLNGKFQEFRIFEEFKRGQLGRAEVTYAFNLQLATFPGGEILLMPASTLYSSHFRII